MKKNKHKSNANANHNFKNKILCCAPTSLQTFSCFYTRRGRLSRSEVDPAAPETLLGAAPFQIAHSCTAPLSPSSRSDDLSHLYRGMRLPTPRQRNAFPRREQRFCEHVFLVAPLSESAGKQISTCQQSTESTGTLQNKTFSNCFDTLNQYL